MKEAINEVINLSYVFSLFCMVIYICLKDFKEMHKYSGVIFFRITLLSWWYFVYRGCYSDDPIIEVFEKLSMGLSLLMVVLVHNKVYKLKVYDSSI